MHNQPWLRPFDFHTGFHGNDAYFVLTGVRLVIAGIQHEETHRLVFAGRMIRLLEGSAEGKPMYRTRIRGRDGTIKTVNLTYSDHVHVMPE